MSLSRQWANILACENAPIIPVVTLHPSGADPAGRRHLAAEPGAICVALDRTARGPIEIPDSRSGRTIPAYPWLAEWPVIDEQLSVVDHRATIGQTALRFLRDAGLAQRLGTTKGKGATARVDLWAPGVDLQDVLPRSGGRLVGDVPMEMVAASLTATLSDGQPDRGVQFPGAIIDIDHFPSAPANVLGLWAMQVILGNYPRRVICPQISTDYMEYFVQTPPATRFPTQVERGGVTVPTGNWVFSNRVSAGGLEYTHLHFNTPTTDLKYGETSEISVTGGVGVTSRNALIFLAEVAGYQWAPKALSLLKTRSDSFDFAALFNKQGDVWQLIQELCGQTPFVPTFERGRLDLIDLTEEGPVATLRLGSELIYRLPQSLKPTGEDRVWNDIEVRCGRDHYGSTSTATSPLFPIRKNPSIPSKVRHLQARSYQSYGHESQKFEAPDLAVQRDHNGLIVGCPAGQVWADTLARIHSFPHQQYAYRVRRLVAEALPRGHLVRLHDDTEGLGGLLCRVVGRRFEATGPTITVESTDSA